MSRAKAAQRAAAQNVTTTLGALLSPARAEASRRNGVKSRGPKTPEGKARSAKNALKHGLRAEKFVVLGDEDLDEFDALEAALMAVLAPQDPLQAVLARRIVAAAWRLERAERIEAELLAQNMRDTASFGLGMIRDANGPRAFDTLLRYRGGTWAEFFRGLRTLKALQAEAAQEATQQAIQPPAAAQASPRARPNQPEGGTIPGDVADAPVQAPAIDDAMAAPAAPLLAARPETAAPRQESARAEPPKEPEARGNPGGAAPPAPATAIGWLANKLMTSAVLPAQWDRGGGQAPTARCAAQSAAPERSRRAGPAR